MKIEHKYRTVAGAIMASIGLFTEVINEWLHHFFYAAFNLAE